MLAFARYHGAGNDYIIIPPANNWVGSATDWPDPPPPAGIRRLCARQRGLGGDGLIWGPLPVADGDFGLRIFNPDGSEAELSGNGLRIFARFLWDEGMIGDDWVRLVTPARAVTARVTAGGARVTVRMGAVLFDRPAAPVEQMTVAGETVALVALHVGNPHCVVLDREPTPALARRLGPILETHPRFPARTNVQFLQIRDRGTIFIEIWERGAGYTLASGSSSCAAAAVAHRLGRCAANIEVHMPGGTLAVGLTADGQVAQSGPVAPICKGTIAPDLWAAAKE